MASTRLLTLIVLIVLSSLLAATVPEDGNDKTRPGGERVVGRIENINLRTQSLSIRVGDGTTTFSFDNRTIFTYGDHAANARDLRIGNEVFVKAVKGTAVKVNGTQQIEGVIEQIDSKGGKLVIKVGDQIQEIPFTIFSVATPDGRAATVYDMKVGDGVLLNVNMGLQESETKNKRKP